MNTINEPIKDNSDSSDNNENAQLDFTINKNKNSIIKNKKNKNKNKKENDTQENDKDHLAINIDNMDDEPREVVSVELNDNNNDNTNTNQMGHNLVNELKNHFNDQELEGEPYIGFNVERYFKNEFEKKKPEIEHLIEQEFEKRDESSKSTESSSSEIRKQLAKEILTELIFPDDKESIQKLIEKRKFYSGLLSVVRVLKVIFSALIVPAFLLADIDYRNYKFNFVAGITSFFVSALEMTDRMIVNSNRERLKKINDKLSELGIKYKMADTLVEDPMGTTNNQQPHQRKTANSFRQVPPQLK